MSLHQLGQEDEARFELLQARNVIEDRFSYPLDHGVAQRGMWFDWVLARMLLREATGLLARAPEQTVPAVNQPSPRG
jgi:hypothetical protein